MFILDQNTREVQAWFAPGCPPLFFISTDAGPLMDPRIVHSLQELLDTFCADLDSPSADIVNLVAFFNRGPINPPWVIRHDGDIQNAINRVLVSNYPYRDVIETDMENLRDFFPAPDNDQ